MNLGFVAVHACAVASGLGYFFPAACSTSVALLYNVGCMMNRYSTIAVLVALYCFAIARSVNFLSLFAHVAWWALNCFFVFFFFFLELNLFNVEQKLSLHRQARYVLYIQSHVLSQEGVEAKGVEKGG